KDPLDVTNMRDCKITVDGQEYFYPRGYYSHEDQLKPCRAWLDFQIRHKRVLEKDLRSNYCRNPGDYSKPYCYGYMSNKKQSCNVTLCPELQFYRTSQRGEEYFGNMNQSLERGCTTLCTAHKGLGPACRESMTKEWVPCDIPMNEIPVQNTSFRNEDILIPMTTWYVHPSPDRIKFLGAGEMLIRLPEAKSLVSTSFTMKFRLRLADPRDANAFYFNMNLLPDDSFVDYYNLTFAESDIELQRFFYKFITLYNPKNDSKEKHDEENDGEEETEDDDENWTVNRTEIQTNIETSGKFNDVPWLRMRYEWVDFFLEIQRARIALYFADNIKPFLELKVPYQQFGASDWKFKERNVIAGYSPPKYVNFHSHKGTLMVAITEVNSHFFECIHGIVKRASNNAMNLLPMAAMPIDYADEYVHPSSDLKNLTRPRRLTLELGNIPAAILFTSAPLYKGTKTSADDDIMGIFIFITKKILILRLCTKIAQIRKPFDVLCEKSKGRELKHAMSEPIPDGGTVIISMFNQIGSGSIKFTEMTLSFHKYSHNITSGIPMYLRYWTIAKEDYPPFDAYPLKFSILSKPRCDSSSFNVRLSDCLVGETSLDGKRKNMRYREEYGGQITWTKTGKSCLPWSFFDNWLLVLLFGDRIPKENFCTYLPNDAYNSYNEENSEAKGKERENNEDIAVNSSFWCFVSLGREWEDCDIPKCADIYSEMECGITPEYKECDLNDIPNEVCTNMFLCDDIPNTKFILNLNAPTNEVTGLKNQIFNASDGFEFQVRSYSSLLVEPFCVYLYHTETYPIAVFKITNSTLSMRYLGLPWYELQAVSHQTNYYLNTWSYNKYIITRSKKGWHLFHGSDVLPSITYHTALALYFSRFSGCDSSIPTNAAGQMVVLSMKVLPHTEEIREVLIATANPNSGDENDRGIAEVDRFYPIGKRYEDKEQTLIYFNIIIRTEYVFYIKFYRHLPWPSLNSSAFVRFSNLNIQIFGIPIGTASLHKKPVPPPHTMRFNLIIKIFRVETHFFGMRVHFVFSNDQQQELSFYFSYEPLRYYGVEVEEGTVEFIMF
ncbi:hypothetical protein SK128_022391, partial [Halocaridina rubra]